jgi:hypothetical protein
MTRRIRRYTIDGGRFTLDGADLLVSEPPPHSLPDGWGWDWQAWRSPRRG